VATSGWFDIGDGQNDYRWSAEQGAVLRESSFHLDGGEYPCRILSSLAVFVQLSEEGAAALAGGVQLAALFRRAGVGRVRKDLSIPLQPSADRIWIQALGGDAVLVLRRESGPDHAAFFRLGQLSDAARSLGHTFGSVGVEFVLADDFLPDAAFRHLQRLVELRRAWGAQIDCTADG
jgi:hypothetical protein